MEVSNISRLPIWERGVGVKDKYIYFFKIQTPTGWRQTNATANSLEDLKKKLKVFIRNELKKPK